MSVYETGTKKKIWWYRFMFDGQLIRRSTKQSNHQAATELEAAHKTALSKERDDRAAAAKRYDSKSNEVTRCPECDKWLDTRSPVIASDGKTLCSKTCRDTWQKKHRVVPTLAEFAGQFLAWAAGQFQAKPKTLAYYTNSVRCLLKYAPLMSLPLDDERIPEQLVPYIAKRQADGVKVATVNHELRCVRRLLRLAMEWKRIESVPKIKLLSGESHRERVISREEEARYLASASPLLAEIVTVLVDTGFRPEECYRLAWESITWVNGRNGTLMVTHGKTKAARRVLPMTPRVRHILETRWNAQGKPAEGYVWPAPTKSKHVEPSSLKKQHSKALRLSKVRPFVLYSLRHTFLTRLGASGCDTWTLARIAGHSAIAMSMRYVHPDDDAVLAGMERPDRQIFDLTRQEIGHGTETEKEARQLSA
jgi:integrase